MKDVKSIKTFAEYKAEVRQPLFDEILKTIQKTKKKLPKVVRIVTSIWWKVIMILFIIGALICGSASFFLTINESSTNLIIMSISLGSTLLLLAIGMFVLKKLGAKNIGSVYCKAMNQRKLFKIAIENFDELKLVSVEHKESDLLSILSIPFISGGGDAPKRSPLFTMKYKNKYTVYMQSGLLSYEITVPGTTGNNGKLAHMDTGFVSIDTTGVEKDFFFSLNHNEGHDFLKKMHLENRKFVRKTKIRSNNKLKTRMVYTPLAMEETLKHYKNIKLSFDFIKTSDTIDCRIATVNKQLTINAKRCGTDRIMANAYVKDIMTDFYEMLSIVGLAFIPPLL